VSGAGAVVSGHAFNITSANVTHVSTGVYCIDLSGIGITTSNAAPIVTPDLSDPATLPGDEAYVLPSTSANRCPSNQRQVGVHAYDRTGNPKDLGFVIAFM
jgi:hypothetical protein